MGAKKKGLTTRLIHGPEGSRFAAGATLPPVTFSTSFEHASAEDFEAVFADRREGMIYSRLQNPTVAELEARITDACGAAGTVATASGMSAITLGLMALLQAGDEIVAGQFLFGGTYTLFTKTLRDMGVKVHLFDPRDPAAARKLLNANTRAVFLEAIANPAMVVPDFSAYRELCASHGVPLVVDASLLSPYLFDAEGLGADLAFFSASKYLAGAASIVGGLIVDTGRFPWDKKGAPALKDFQKAGQEAFLRKVRKQMMAGVGPNLSPMNAFLILLGMETLPLRFERMCESAQQVAAFLREHPRVEQVLFPGLPDDPFHAITAPQFKGRNGTMISFSLDSREACFRFLNGLQMVKRATNLGDTKSIALHPASTIYANYWPAEQEQLGVTEGMIRFSVGLEDPEDIIADLEQALAA